MERKRNYIYPDKESLVAAFVCEFQRTMKVYSEQGKLMHVALSGGSTPLEVFRLLAELSSKEEWAHVHLYWGDERCVPPRNRESNYGHAWQSLLEPLQLKPEQIHRIRGEENPAEEARRYGDMLSKQLPQENGFPVFDWIWLGLGEDGHTASIFPQQIELWTSGSPCIVASQPLTGQTRISISGGVINAAKRVSFIVSGREKATIIKEIFLKQGSYMEYPAFYVNPASGNLEWYLDQSATSLL
jgi:6-phosphogluconolactonase